MVLVLGACGFQPVYGTKAGQQSVSAALQGMEISSIPDREGQILRNHLIDRFHLRQTPTNPQYRLAVSAVNGRTVRLGIARDATTTRAQYEANVTYVLKDARADEVLLTRTARSLASYNVLSSEFQTVVTEEDAQDRVLNQLADQIETQISLYFNR